MPGITSSSTGGLLGTLQQVGQATGEVTDQVDNLTQSVEALNQRIGFAFNPESGINAGGVPLFERAKARNAAYAAELAQHLAAAPGRGSASGGIGGGGNRGTMFVSGAPALQPSLVGPPAYSPVYQPPRAPIDKAALQVQQQQLELLQKLVTLFDSGARDRLDGLV